MRGVKSFFVTFDGPATIGKYDVLEFKSGHNFNTLQARMQVEETEPGLIKGLLLLGHRPTGQFELFRGGLR